MLFKQLFENESSTYTYLISCQEKQEVILIDPVLETLERDLEIIRKLNLKLTHAVDTHIHADHVTSASALREILGCKVAGPANDKLQCRDINFRNSMFSLLVIALKWKQFIRQDILRHIFHMSLILVKRSFYSQEMLCS